MKRGDGLPDHGPACAQCIHYRHYEKPERQCDHPAGQAFDIVLGFTRSDPRQQRRIDGRCGPHGSLFEARRGPNWLERNWFMMAALGFLVWFVAWPCLKGFFPW